MKRLALAVLLTGHLMGCGAEQAGSLSESQPIVGPEGQAELWKLDLMLEDRASNSETQRDGPSRYSTFFAPNGSVIRDGVGEVEGPEAIHDAFMADIYSDALADLVWMPVRAGVARSGDLGYTVGQYRTVTIDSLGVRTSVGGMYVRLWRRQPDDSWKVEVEIGRPVTDPEVVELPAPGKVPEN